MTGAPAARRTPSRRRSARTADRRVLFSGGGDGGAAIAPVAGVDAPALQDGEAVLLRVRPAGVLVLIASALGLAASVGVLALLALLFPGGAIVGLPATVAIFGVGQLLAAPALIAWATTRYVLTDRRVLAVWGVLDRRAVELPLVSVRRVTSQSGRGRLGVGTVTAEAPQNAERPAVAWRLVARPAHCRGTIADAVRRYGRHDVDA